MLLLLLLQAIWPILTVHAANEPYTGIDWKTVDGCEEKREENFYVLGCNQVFYRCYDGHAYEYKCPSNLYFDPKRNRCNHLDKTSTCLDEAEYKNKLVRGIKPFDCTGRDGSFEHPESRCDHVYYTCVHGRPIRQHGPIPPSPSYAPYNPVISSPAPPPVPPQGNDDREFNCLNRPDGEYSIGECSNVFWKCANNKAFKYKCPMDLVYNDLTKRCLQKEDIPACKPFDREAARQNFDCSTKVDGYYEKERCQPYFYSCVAGRTEVLECTTGLVFDARISACDYPLACKWVHH
ncbi:chitin binding Peritrophin-A domain protein [Teladorsagia circumcincta]|uniref:Chitin binding Peritrophin-A domain protein n=1 Tax=Teladorsagia circumcincta TaxID=45464 RepID=A0A2G9URI0_TELCI|nr:chitin binding Peritrophin-A domain protein [Teladorsagia circumcincta]